MNVEFDVSFHKSIKKLLNPRVKSQIGRVINEVEQAQNIDQLKSIKKMSGHKGYYRIRIGDYRIGLRLIDEQTVRFIIVANRRDIYSQFP